MIKGKIHVVGHNINTDMIHPPEYFSLNYERIRNGFMKGISSGFMDRFEAGDIIIAGQNFGCGSSRETSIYSMLYNHVGAIVAISFARIFYRNAVNNKLPVFEFKDPMDYFRIEGKDLVNIEIDLKTSDLCLGDYKIPLLVVPHSLQKWLHFSVLPSNSGCINGL